MSEVLHEEVSDVIGLDSFSSVDEVMADNDTSGSLNPLTAIALILSFSTLYLQWNRYAASRDAADYAARIKSQQQLREEKSPKKDKEESVNSGSDLDSSDKSNSSDKSDSQEEDNKRRGEDDDEEEDFEIVDLPAEVEKDIAENYTSSLKQNGVTKPYASTDSVEDYSNEDTKKALNDKVIQWRCVCEGGFLPPGMFGGAEAVFRLGTGQCYHKQA